MDEHRLTAKSPKVQGRLRGLLFVLALVAVMVAIASIIVVVVMMLLPLPMAKATVPPVPVPDAGGFTGIGTLVGGAFLLFLLLVPFYLIGFGLLLCCCIGKAGLPALPLPPLPGLPDVKRLGAVLRGIAAELERLADIIDGAANAAKGLRDGISDELINLSRPIVRTHSETYGPVTVDVFDRVEWTPMFNNDQKTALRSWKDKFAADGNGNDLLSTTATSLRTQATALKQQASALDGQPA